MPSAEAPGESPSWLPMAPRAARSPRLGAFPSAGPRVAPAVVPRSLFCPRSSRAPFLSAPVTALRPQGTAQGYPPIPGSSTDPDPCPRMVVSAGLGLGPIRGAADQFTRRRWAEGKREEKAMEGAIKKKTSIAAKCGFIIKNCFPLYTFKVISFLQQMCFIMKNAIYF